MTEDLYRPGLEGVIAGETTLSSVEQVGLWYRGYSIEDLAESCTFGEVAHLLWYGELPDRKRLEELRTLGALLAEWTDSGRSVIMTTHDLDLGLSWGQRAGVLRGGKVNFPGAESNENGDIVGDNDIRQAVADALEAGR